MLLLLQVPPVTPSVRVVVLPAQTVAAPVIEPAYTEVPTVTVTVADAEPQELVKV